MLRRKIMWGALKGRYCCGFYNIYDSILMVTVCYTVHHSYTSSHKISFALFLWKVKKNIEKKNMRESRRGWRKRNNKEPTEFSSCSVRSFLSIVGVRWFWVWGILVSGSGTMMEESRWRIKAGLIAYGLQIHLHLLKGDPWGSLASPQAKPPISRAAIVWIWRMRLSLTFTSHRTSQRLEIPHHRFAVAE